MTKKEEALREYRKMTDAIPYPVDKVLWAIIDALPDEAPPEIDPNQWPHLGGLGGPEPVEVKASEPTSNNYSQPVGPNRWFAWYIAQENRAGTIQNNEQYLRWSELTQAQQDAILGQRSDPPAPSGATQDPIQDRCDKIARKNREMCQESDARKLRIMKAMEEIGAGQKAREFVFSNGEWMVKGCFANFPVLEYLERAPEEPLWEGEAMLDEARRVRYIDNGPLHYTHPMQFGWRKIKVREVR